MSYMSGDGIPGFMLGLKIYDPFYKMPEKEL